MKRRSFLKSVAAAGATTLIPAGAVGGLLVRLLRIENRVYCFLLGCVMAAFPMITALFAYMFTSHSYMIGLLMMTISACLICEKTSWGAKGAAMFLGGAVLKEKEGKVS